MSNRWPESDPDMVQAASQGMFRGRFGVRIEVWMPRNWAEKKLPGLEREVLQLNHGWLAPIVENLFSALWSRFEVFFELEKPAEDRKPAPPSSSPESSWNPRRAWWSHWFTS